MTISTKEENEGSRLILNEVKLEFLTGTILELGWPLRKGKVSIRSFTVNTYLLHLYDIKEMAFFSIFFVKCISFCDLRSIRQTEIYCAMSGKKSKCRIKNGKQGAGGVESSKKKKTEVCACARAFFQTPTYFQLLQNYLSQHWPKLLGRYFI